MGDQKKPPSTTCKRIETLQSYLSQDTINSIPADIAHALSSADALEMIEGCDGDVHLIGIGRNLLAWCHSVPSRIDMLKTSIDIGAMPTEVADRAIRCYQAALWAMRVNDLEHLITRLENKAGRPA